MKYIFCNLFFFIQDGTLQRLAIVFIKSESYTYMIHHGIVNSVVIYKH